MGWLIDWKRGREGEQEGKKHWCERESSINKSSITASCMCPGQSKPTIQPCALTRNRTGELLLCEPHWSGPDIFTNHTESRHSHKAGADARPPEQLVLSPTVPKGHVSTGSAKQGLVEEELLISCYTKWNPYSGIFRQGPLNTYAKEFGFSTGKTESEKVLWSQWCRDSIFVRKDFCVGTVVSKWEEEKNES